MHASEIRSILIWLFMNRKLHCVKPLRVFCSLKHLMLLMLKQKLNPAVYKRDSVS